MTDETPVPPGGVIPSLSIASGGGLAAVEFYRAAFGAEALFRLLSDDGERLVHGTLRINDGLLMLADHPASPGQDVEPVPTGVTLHLRVDDADEWWNRAVTAGAVPVLPLENQAWGDRYGRVMDPFGHCWSIAAPVKA